MDPKKPSILDVAEHKLGAHGGDVLITLGKISPGGHHPILGNLSMSLRDYVQLYLHRSNSVGRGRN